MFKIIMLVLLLLALPAMGDVEIRKAAEQGNANAQHNLGFLYVNGEGVIQDNIQTHMWWNIAAASGNKAARKNRDIVAKKMTPAAIEKAQALAREWMAAHPD
jgi:TPR repeat protein